MEIKILGWEKAAVLREAPRFWLSPDEQYAVAEIWRGELFVVGRVTGQSDKRLTMEFIQAVEAHPIAVDSRSWQVRWTPYGFCKLLCQELESGETTVRRVYYDRKKYEKMRRKLHGADREEKADSNEK